MQLGLGCKQRVFKKNNRFIFKQNYNGRALKLKNSFLQGESAHILDTQPIHMP